MLKILPVLLLLLFWPFSTAHAEDVIKLGIAGPFTGEIASLGDDVRAGATQAIEDVNASGGVLGKKLQAVFEDDACDPKTGVAAANRLITENVAMATAFCSKVCMSVAPIYAEENIPFLNECNTDEITAHGWSNVIRVYLKNAQEAPKLAALIASKASGHKLGMLYFTEEYNFGLAENIIKLLADKHLAPDITFKLPEKTDDFSAIITKLKDQKIDMVYLGMWPKSIGLFLRQAAAADYHPLMIGNLAASLDDVSKIAGPAANGLIFTATPDPQYIPGSTSVIRALAAKNIINRPQAIYAYLLVQVYAEAARQAGGSDKAKVLEILKTKKFATILGNVSFTKDGDMNGVDFDYYQWQDGKMVPLKH